MFDSTRIIAEKQFNMGKVGCTPHTHTHTHTLIHPLPQSLYDDATQQVSGPVQFRHSFVDFSNVPVNISGRIVHTCPPAMGESFAAGTTDGPGAFDFTQGE